MTSDFVELTCVAAPSDGEEELYPVSSDPMAFIARGLQRETAWETRRTLGQDAGVSIDLLPPVGFVRKPRSSNAARYSPPPPELPAVVHDVLVAIGSSGITVAVYSLLKTWVDARNGRKLKIKVGDIEVEATQMKEKDVLRIFELLQEKADRAKILDILLEAKESASDDHLEERLLPKERLLRLLAELPLLSEEQLQERLLSLSPEELSLLMERLRAS
jgi:hypothetical protein